MRSESERPTSEQMRTYDRAKSAVFRKTHEAFGGLSNMAGGFPLSVQGTRIYTSEALYQACRFPHLPNVQRLIIGEASPMTAKMKSKPHRHNSRADWDRVRVRVMRWCLRVKLAQNWERFSEVLLSTGDRPIVEESRKDDFWGAKPVDERCLAGKNVLGRLLMELRETVETRGAEAFQLVEPPAIPGFLLFGRQVETIKFAAREPESWGIAEAATGGARRGQASLFSARPARGETPSTRTAEEPERLEPLGHLKWYSAMKGSGVAWLGDVPAHWAVKPGRACFKERKLPNPGLAETSVLSLSYGRIVVKPLERLHGLVPASFDTYQIVEPGDIVVRPTDLQNDWNSLRFGLSGERGIITSAYLCFRTKRELTPQYGHLLLHAYDLMKVFYGLGSGLRQNLDWSDFKYLPCLVPPASEQVSIVSVIDRADRRIRHYIRAKQELIRLLEEQKLAIIRRAVTRGLEANAPLRPSGVEWLGQVPAHWEIWQIGHFAVVGNGSTPSRGNPNYWVGGDYPWLNSSSVNEGTISASKQFVTSRALRECHLPRVRPGSVLVALTGQGKTRGKAAVLTIEATINQHIAFITPRRQGTVAIPEYLQQFLLAAYFELRRMSDDSGSTKGALTCEDLRHFRVLLPPVAEQREIIKRVSDATAAIESTARLAEHEILLLQEYRTRLIIDVVTGKLDVAEAAARLRDEPAGADRLAQPDVLLDVDDDAGEDATLEEIKG